MTAVQLFSLVVAVVLGLAIVAAKVSAQPAKGAALAPAGLAGGATVHAPAPSASAPPAPDAAASAPAMPDGGSPIDYAVMQTEDDMPKGASDEEKAAIGTGKVPIHREGRFRSPFAHPRFGGPATAKVGLVLNEVREYNIQTGSFQAEFFVSLTSDKEMPDLNLAFTNGHEVTSTTLADTPTFKFYKVGGTFTGPIDLRTYPFDAQRLPLEIEDQKAGVDQIVFEPDNNRTSLDEGFAVPGWNLSQIAARAYRHLYPPRFDRDDLYVSRYKFELVVDRFGLSAALSVFVPAFMIVLISLTGMWIPPDGMEVRSNTGAPMLAAAVLFHYALIQSLPATGYLTRADKVMMGTYVCLLLNMFSTWLFFVVDEEHMDRTFKLGRAAVPTLSFLVMLLASIR